MNEQLSNTKQKILDSAKKEFLEKGFKNSSLRNISKSAGVTTGAIYGYFKDKNSLFIELVKDVINGLKKLVQQIEGEEFESDIIDLFNTEKDRQNMVQVHNKYIDYIYDNFDIMKLIVLCSDGSSVENYIEDLSQYLTNINTIRINRMEKKLDKPIDEFVLHMIVKFYITSVCELIEHNIYREDALKYITSLSTFFFGGWAEILKIN